MHFVLPFLLGLTRLANAAYSPSLAKTNATDIATRDEWISFRGLLCELGMSLIYIRHY
jgi:hypothetical protein